MIEQYFSRARHLIRVTLIACVLSAAGNAAADTLNAIGSGGGGQLGQLLALTDDRQRMSDYHGSILPPQVKLARIYLHYYPESLKDDGLVEAYARHFFPEELASAQRSTGYKTSPFKRRSVINGWRTRLSNLDSSETLTLNIFMPAMLNTNQYDFDAQAFPVSFALTEESLISSGVLGLTCLKLDKTFSLDAFKVPESDAQAFMAQNRNSRLPGRGASIFVGVQLKITGKPRTDGARPPRCQLAAEVLSVDALEYLSTDDYSATYARPGDVLISFFSRGSTLIVSASVQATYDERTLPTDAPAEARAFNLETRRGLIVMPSGTGGPTWLLRASEAMAALTDYGNFLGLGVHPEAFVTPRVAHCMTQKYLTAADGAAYFGDRSTQGWRGSTEFEKKRTEAAFKEQALPKLQLRAVHAPQRFLILSEVILPEYDFERGGFWFRGINASATIERIHADCGNGLRLLPAADQVHEFWTIAPAEAEAVLNSMPVERKVGTLNIRTAYLATEVELANLIAARPKQQNQTWTEQPPLRLKVISSTLYAGQDLGRVLYSLPVIRAAASVLEAGLPDTVVYSKSYRIDYGSGGDLLRQLKARGSFEDWEWPQLMRQQMIRDTRYYSLIKPHYRPASQSPAVPMELDEQYTPFFPHGTEDVRAGLLDRYMTDAQKALFIEWAKRQAAVLP